MNLELKILIVEDSISFALELNALITKLGYNIQKTVDNAEEALNIIKSNTPDLILLDIELNGEMTGVDLSKKIAHLKIPIIFITSSLNEEYYTEAKNAKTLAYLSKPISSFSLRASIETAINNTFYSKQDDFSKNGYLFIKKKHIYHKININSITHIKSGDNYCEVYTIENEIFLLREKISNILGKLIPIDNFIRIHRQFIVQLNKIEFYDVKESHILIGSNYMPVSRTYKQELEKFLKKQI